ncbi:hypothetical protein V6Z11_A11G238300 [Gossypium hirsutum]
MYAELGNPHSQGSMRLPKWRHVFHFQSSSPTSSEVGPWPSKYSARIFSGVCCDIFRLCCDTEGSLKNFPFCSLWCDIQLSVL